MKGDPIIWTLARASGIIAYVLVTSSVLAGLVLKARPFGTSLKPAVITDLHRFLALLGLGAVSVHGLALALDTAVPISVADLFVPGLVPYRRLATSLGVLAGELMLVVYASFSLRKRIGARTWRRLHWATYLVFAFATIHGIVAGTDGSTTWALALYGASTGAVLAASAWRILVPPQKGAPRVSRRDRPLAV